MPAWQERSEAFCRRFDLGVPVLLAPMAGISAPELSMAVARAGGLGACGALLMSAEEIAEWARTVRGASIGAFQINLWVPDPAPRRAPDAEADLRTFLARFGPAVASHAGDATPPDFDDQCAALLASGAPILSSVMGVFPPGFVDRIKARGLAWFAAVSTVAEALEAAKAGADVIVAQGAEAGGHRAAFDANTAESRMVGLLSLIPAIVDAVDLPVVATGGIADARTMAAALLLGASAVQIGTGFLRCPEAKIPPVWADAIAAARPEDTIVSRVFSGRAGRSLLTDYVRAAVSPETPSPAAYPVQRGLTSGMRSDAVKSNDVQRMQAWAGQSAALARAEPAAEFALRLWSETQELLTE